MKNLLWWIFYAIAVIDGRKTRMVRVSKLPLSPQHFGQKPAENLAKADDANPQRVAEVTR